MGMQNLWRRYVPKGVRHIWFVTESWLRKGKANIQHTYFFDEFYQHRYKMLP